MDDLINRIGNDLNVPPELITKGFSQAHVKFKKIRIPKKSGGFRTAIQPTVELKLIQDWFVTQVLCKLPISRAATAFRSGSTILANATAHQTALYSVRIDIESFFPSIRFSDLASVLAKHKAQLDPFVETKSFHAALQLACFDASGNLPIGYPSSPMIANVVMYDFDNEIIEIIQRNPEKYGLGQITRYADDFVFSTDKKGACRSFVITMHDLVTKTISPKLTINEAKTRFMSRLGGSTIITGLRITNDAEVRVHSNYRDHVRLLLKLCAEGRLPDDEVKALVGHLAFVEHADPKLFTRLSFKYYEIIHRLRAFS